MIAATGALEPPSDGSLGGDHLVGPVGKLSAKFAALGEYLRRHQGGVWGKELRLLVPTRTIKGARLTEAHAKDLSALSAAAAALGVTLSVHPIARLSEAARIVGAVERRKPPREAWARLGAFAGALAFTLALFAGGLLLSPLEMRFSPVMVGLGEVATPARSIYDGATESYVYQPHCRGSDGAPHVQTDGGGLSFTVTAGGGWAPLGSYKFLAVVAEENLIDGEPSLKIFTMSALPVNARPRQTADGAAYWGMRLPVEKPAEAMRLFVLGRKLIPFDATALERDLTASIKAVGLGRRINAAMSHLNLWGATRLAYGFHGVGKLENCIYSGSP